MAYPIAFPATMYWPLLPGTSLLSSQPPPPPVTAVMTTESFDAPEGMYVCTSRFTSPPQPMIHLNPLPTTQLGLSVVYPTPHVSTVSLQYPLKNTKSSDPNSADSAISPAPSILLEAPIASQGIDPPASSLTGGLLPGSAGPPAGITGISGPAMGFSGLGETMGKLAAKPTCPKNSLKNTSSSFVNHIITHPNLTKILATHTDSEHFAFLTNTHSFFWLADTHSHTKESLAQVTFTASPLAHNINQFT
ncbi:related to WD40 repeat protein CreC [Ustilago bromivora]|uniref:Related to WD40 repeat protein CreC n=1 Tax=Ustilago bromivora TaxID=307758 RepID=A0A1K0GZJ1_9BASI|nr:related to WD40 repeat protein CreC [Ustilago bromivora]SYW77474.1 related to WD40 repeat protein CreC [Ustilago bromivora]